MGSLNPGLQAVSLVRASCTREAQGSGTGSSQLPWSSGCGEAAVQVEANGSTGICSQEGGRPSR